MGGCSSIKHEVRFYVSFNLRGRELNNDGSIVGAIFRVFQESIVNIFYECFRENNGTI